MEKRKEALGGGSSSGASSFGKRLVLACFMFTNYNMLVVCPSGSFNMPTIVSSCPSLPALPLDEQTGVANENSKVDHLYEVSPRGFVEHDELKDDDEEDDRMNELSSLLLDLDMSSAEAADNGTGGVYIVPDRKRERRLVFKPSEEENATTHGEGFLKEFAAYLVDNGLAGVPETGISVLNFPDKGAQLGSIQTYVEESEDAEDFGPGVFETADVHRIGVLDIRILNMDRHSGNIMRNKRTGKLVPIDHGTSFPNAFAGQLADVSLEWLQYPQAKVPFDEQLLHEIAEINVEEDILKLNSIGLDEGSQLATWMSTTLLKLGAQNGKTLYEIGTLVQRQNDRTKPSHLETLFHEALNSCSKPDKSDFFETFRNRAERVMNQI